MSLDPEYNEVKKEKSETKKIPETKYPSELVDLPSKGLVYSKDNPLSSGQVELKYMTAKEEDILTSQNLIQKGVVLDKLLESLIIGDTNYSDLILGDKNAIMVAARILGYGKNYTIPIKCPVQGCDHKEEYTIDLTSLTDLKLDEKAYNRDNQYEFELPNSKIVIGFKLLTQGDEKKITDEIKHINIFNKKSKKKDIVSSDYTTRLKYVIISVNGKGDQKTVRQFIDRELLSRDSFEFRKHLKAFTPDIDMTFNFECPECGGTTAMAVPMTVEFFWPSTSL